MGKNHSMSRVERSRREKVTRYSVRKVSFGAASVAVAAFFMFLGNGAVYAAGPNVTATGSALAATPANNQLDENSGASDSIAPKGQADTTTPAPADSSSTSVESAPASKVQDETPAPTPADATPAPVVSSTTSATEGTEKSVDDKPKKRRKRDLPATSTTTTNTDDPAANQTYAAPDANASVKDLSDKLQGLQDTVENNSKIQNMKAIGDSKGVAVGSVAEINEFGGWNAVNQADGQAGTFAIARKTADDVFPLETINTTIDDTVWLREQAFDRTSDYMLFLAKPRNRQTKDSRVLDGSDYKYRGEGSGVSKNIVGFNGIEKTFKTYFKDTDGIVRIKFKTGYTGDDDGHKASYKVEVFAIREGVETKVYETTFDPSQNANDAQKIVKKANDGRSGSSTIRISQTPRDSTNSWNTRQNYVGKEEAERRIAQPQNKPNGTPGTFESKDISLGKGSDSYKVRISLANPNVAGGSYQSWDTKYTLPVSGVDFSIAQDTSAIAKDLLQKIYDKLTDSKTNDVVWATPETKRAYEEKLKEAEVKLKESALKTRDYKQFATELIEKYEHLKEKTQIIDSSIDIIEEAKKAKDREIEDNADLSQTEKQAAKDAVAKAATAAKNAIDAAKDQDGINQAKAAGESELDKVSPLSKDSAKAAIDSALVDKEAAIDANDKLSEAEKSAAKAAAKQAADDAKKAIDAATTQAEVDRILRNDIYKDDAAINEVEAFDLSSLLVNGFVSVKQGETLTDQEVLSKVNLPKDVEVIKVEKPTTSALGRLVAKVTLKLSDGSVEEINVPVEVVAPQNHGNEGNGANNAANNTDAKVNKAKLEGAIHQLDELIIQESAKFDAETAKEANALSADAKKVFANAAASQVEVDAMVKRIEDFMTKVASSTDHATPANDQAAQKPAVAPATTQAAVNANQEAAANARTVAKELPNTGTADSTVAMVAAAASALLGLGLAGRRRKEDEEA